MKLAEILNGPEKWCQGVLRNGDRYCLVGAMLKLDGTGVGHDFWKAELLRMARIAGVGRGQVGKWNDGHGRTWEEVAAVVGAYDRDRIMNS